MAVDGVHQDLRTLMGVLVPSLAQELELRSQRQVCDVVIPEEIRYELEAEFASHPSFEVGGYPPLRDMADSFIDNIDRSTTLFHPGRTIDTMAPPLGQYICLLKCQFLMEKIKTADELLRAPPLSHWPAYLQSLEEVSTLSP